MTHKKNNKTLISRGELRVGNTLELRKPNKAPKHVKTPVRVNEDGTFEYKYKGKTITVTSPSAISCHIYGRMTNGWDCIYDIDKDKTISVVCKSRPIIKRSRIQPRCGPKSKKKNANKKKSLREKVVVEVSEEEDKKPAATVKDASTQVDNPVTIDREFLIKIINEQSEQLQKQREQIVALEKSDAAKMRRIGFLEKEMVQIEKRLWNIR